MTTTDNAAGKTEKIKVSPFKGGGNLSEIYQSSSIRIALLHKIDDENFEQISPLVACCDFLTDSFSATKEKAKFSIYGYSWDGNTQSPDWDAGRFLIKAGKGKELENFKQNFKLIHVIEDKNDIPRSKVYNADGITNAVALECHESWLANCLTIRLYLYLVRICGYKFQDALNWLDEIRKMDVSDGKYAESIPMENWNKILNDLNSIKDTGSFCGLRFKDGVSRLHHNSGLVSVAGGNHSEINPSVVVKNKHYQILKDRGFKMRY